jgi:diketogulonate reductase-like aldo/keto reductase
MNATPTISLHTGSKMPRLGLGTWQLTNDTAGTVLAALQMGYRLIDTSGDYGTQPGIGEAIKKSGLERAEIYVVTKVEEIDDAYQATKKNLQELDLAYADLMLVHRPPPIGFGQELWEGLIYAKQEGLAKDIGVSNYSSDQIQALADTSGEAPTVNQIEWSPFGYSEEMLSYCIKNQIVIQAYSPLTRTQRLNEPMLLKMAAQYGKASAQLLLRWNLQRGTVPLPKANQLGHQKENLAVFDFEITDKDMEALNQLNEKYSSLGSLPYI